MSVARGGKALLRKRNNLGDARLTESQWRREWESSRLFLTADGEKGKACGNETIRWNPGTRRLEVKLPAPLARLANQPHGRYRLSATVEFGYRGDEVAAQASTGAVRYDITRCPHPSGPSRDRWYIDASWKATPTPAASLEELPAAVTRGVVQSHRRATPRVTSRPASSRPTATSSAGPATIGLDLAVTARTGEAIRLPRTKTGRPHGPGRQPGSPLAFAAARLHRLSC